MTSFSDSPGHYDLLTHPEWKAISVLVVSPYVERRFFEFIVNQLKPRMLTVIIDDSCRPEYVQMIRSLETKHTKIRIALSCATGLVHGKLFHVKWLTTGKNRSNTFIFGSGNATRQAFDGNLNSEIMCKVRLTAKNHEQVLSWLEKLRAAASAVPIVGRVIPEIRDVELARGVHIRLPSMRIRAADDKVDSFDQWLQRGHIVSAYRPDLSFLRVEIKLRSILALSAPEESAMAAGFDIRDTQRLAYRYLPEENVTVTDDNLTVTDDIGQWRSRLCIWTQLGDWCSDACFQASPDAFRRTGYEARIQNLNSLSAFADENLRRRALKLFLRRVNSLWSRLGDEAPEYLESSNKALNDKYYKDLFKKHLDRDLARSHDEEFRRRYINGYETVDLPQFRLDTAAWKSFCESFVAQLHIESTKKSRSLIYKRISNALAETDHEDFWNYTNSRMAEALRSHWNHKFADRDRQTTTAGNYINDYHNDYPTLSAMT